MKLVWIASGNGLIRNHPIQTALRFADRLDARDGHH